MITARLSLLMIAVVACKPEPAVQLPEPTPPATTPPLEPAAITDPTPGPGVEPPATDPPAEPTPAPNIASESTPAPIASASEPLPAALHTKIDAKCGNDPGVGTAAKPFTLKTPDGKEISLASYRGKVVLNFWGTWCKPCLKELPEFDRLYRRYRKHGLVLIAIATDTEPAKVQEFATQRKLAAKLASRWLAARRPVRERQLPVLLCDRRQGPDPRLVPRLQARVRRQAGAGHPHRSRAQVVVRTLVVAGRIAYTSAPRAAD